MNNSRIIVDYVNYYSCLCIMKKEIRDRIRDFNRYYTKILGVLNRQYLGSKFSLPETRVIQAIHYNPACSANFIVRMLNIDKSYLSRILKKFEQQNYIRRTTSTEDHRRDQLELTESGVAVFHEIDATANRSVDEMCSALSEKQLYEMVGCMERICTILNNNNDMTEIEISKFSSEYTQDVIDLVLHFQNDGTRPLVSVDEQPDLLTIEESYMKAGGDFWIAREKESGKLIGSIGLMPYTDEIAVLKKFFVYEPFQGSPYHIGQRLYRTLLDFAQKQNIKTILLDTPRNTTRAHKFYEKAGFRLVDETELPVKFSHPYSDCDFFLLDMEHHNI